MTWDVSTPAGNEAISNGDDRIREFKTDLQTALRGNTTDGLIASFPGTSTSTPVFAYRGGRGSTASRPAASADVGLYHNTTLNTIQRCDGSTYHDVATLIPSGTVMVFFQASAPTGWTQNTSHNDKALRVVSGSGGGNGGSTGFTSAWGASNTGSDGAHTHTMTTGGPSTTTEGGSGGGNVADGGHTHSGTSSSNGAHTHTTPAYAPHYVDVIVASKD